MSGKPILDKTLEEYKILFERLKRKLPVGFDIQNLSVEDMNKLNVQDSTKATYVYAVLRIHQKGKLKHREELKKYAKNIRLKYDETAPTSGKELPTIEEVRKIYYTNMERDLTIGSLIVMFYTYPFIDTDSYGCIRNELHNLQVGDEKPLSNTYNPETGKIVIQDTKKSSSEQRIDIDLPSEVNDIFSYYVHTNNIKTGERLFPNLTSNLLSKYLRDYSTKIIGYPVTSTVLRKTYHHRILGDDHKNLSTINSRLKTKCKKMGHSVKTANNYYSKHGRL